MLRFQLPPRGALRPNSDVDPLRYYYTPLVGRVFSARIDLGLQLLPPVRFARVLELGYGSGLLLPTLSQIAETVDGVDLASDGDAVRAELARLGVDNLGELHRGDVRRLPLEDDRYDLVVAFSILEHLHPEELGEALGEVHRVLTPGGLFLVGCPAVHRAMNLAFSAIGFRGIEQHHFSSIHDVLAAATQTEAGSTPPFLVERRATWPRPLPFGLAPYNAVLLRR